MTLGNIAFLSACAGVSVCAGRSGPIPAPAAIDAEVSRVLATTGAKGLALAVVDHGAVNYVHAYGIRNGRGDPLTAHTLMYGASLTKAVFAYTVLHLVDQGKLQLDTPIAADLDRPLPEYGPDPVFPDKYGPYKDLADEPRWKAITPRMCLNHTTGFSNFWFLDKKLILHFQPGTHFSYSGEGLILLQFAIEHGRKDQGLGLDVGDLTQQLFGRLGMTRTSLAWTDRTDPDVTEGWDDQGKAHPHDMRTKVRAAGSMNTTISDFSKFAAAIVRGEGLSKGAYAEMTKRVFHIATGNLFPLFQPDLPASRQRPDLYSGLGVIVFSGPQGPGFYKGGHDGQTANTLVCIQGSQRAVVILSNDVRSEAGFAQLVHFILGDTGVPYDWEYGDRAGKSS